jgi:hypothetical protein
MFAEVSAYLSIFPECSGSSHDSSSESAVEIAVLQLLLNVNLKFRNHIHG